METITYTENVIEKLGKLHDVISPAGFAVFFGRVMTPWLRERAAYRFKNQGDDAVGKWLELASVTQDIRRSGIERGVWTGISPTRPINKRTGDMEAYITKGRGDVTTTSSMTTLHYPQRGTPTAKGMSKKVRRAQNGDSNTPKRPVLALSQTDMEFLISSYGKFLRENV